MNLGETTFSLYETEQSRLAEQRTFVLFGLIRGGTTAATTIATGLGLFIGDKFHNNLEDRDFLEGPRKALNAVEDRNKSRDVWGFKVPNISAQMDVLLPALRNPRLICITRDLTANTLGIKKYAKKDDTAEVMQRCLLNTQRNLMTVYRVQRPTLFLSYEKILQKTDDAIAEASHFLNMPATDEAVAGIKEKIQPGKYQKVATIERPAKKVKRQATRKRKAAEEGVKSLVGLRKSS